MVLAGAAGFTPSGRAIGQPTENGETTDWPVMITRLRQELLRRPGHGQTRRQLAIAYNNYGVSLGNQGQWELAAQQLHEALQLDEVNTQFQANLSKIHLNQAYDAYQRYRVDDARKAIEAALALTPRFPEAYVLLGEMEYNQQRLKEAKAAWQHALELDPTQTDLAERLAQLSQELPVESKFERISQVYFDIRYEEGLERSVGFDLRDALLEARRLVGSDFAYWPRYKLVVLVYSPQQYRALQKELPDWVGGHFDGKIRVPLPGDSMGAATVKGILFHEYTHAVVRDLTKGRCPHWFDEGLAEYERMRAAPRQLEQLAEAFRDNRLVPWSQLEGQVSMKLSAEQAALGYQQSYSIIQYLVSRYGFWRLRRVLKVLDEGRTLEAALEQEFHLKLTRLETLWREWLPELLAGKTP